MVKNKFRITPVTTEVSCTPLGTTVGLITSSTSAIRSKQPPQVKIPRASRSRGLVTLMIAICLSIFLAGPTSAQKSTLDQKASVVQWDGEPIDMAQFHPDYWTFQQCRNENHQVNKNYMTKVVSPDSFRILTRTSVVPGNSVLLQYTFTEQVDIQSFFLLFGNDIGDIDGLTVTIYTDNVERGIEFSNASGTLSSGFNDLGSRPITGTHQVNIKIESQGEIQITVVAAHLYSASNIYEGGRDSGGSIVQASANSCLQLERGQTHTIEFDDVQQVDDLLIVSQPATQIFEDNQAYPYSDYVSYTPLDSQDQNDCNPNTAFFSNFTIAVQAEQSDAKRTFVNSAMTTSSDNVANIVGNNWQLNQRVKRIEITADENSPPVRICHLGVIGKENSAAVSEYVAKSNDPVWTIKQNATEDQNYKVEFSIGFYEYFEQCVNKRGSGTAGWETISFAFLDETIQIFGKSLEVVSKNIDGTFTRRIKIKKDYLWKNHSRYNSERIEPPTINVRFNVEQTTSEDVSATCAPTSQAEYSHQVSFDDETVAQIDPQEANVSIFNTDEYARVDLESPSFPWQVTPFEADLSYTIAFDRYSGGQLDNECWQLQDSQIDSVYLEMAPQSCKPALAVGDDILLTVTRQFYDNIAETQRATMTSTLRIYITDDVADFAEPSEDQVDENEDDEIYQYFIGYNEEEYLDYYDYEIEDDLLHEIEHDLEDELYQEDFDDLYIDYEEQLGFEDEYDFSEGDQNFEGNRNDPQDHDYDLINDDPREEERRKEEQEQTEVVGRHFDPSLLAELQARVFRTQNFSGVDDIKAINESVEDTEVEEPEDIVPVISELNAAGELSIDFDPPNASVPDSWDALWDQEKRVTMTEAELKNLESLVSQIFQVSFEQNSDETPQSFFGNNIGTFSPSGLKVQLNFSDPLLISQGDVPDKVKIRLLKSFFTENKGKDERRRKRRRRNLQPAEEDLYHIFEYDVPKQVKSKDELVSLQETGETAQNAVAGQFVTSIILNIILSGTLSQLWNIFNTMQLLTALPMFSINTPGNVITINDAFSEISNFKIVKKEQLYDWIVVPIFGTSTAEEKAIADGVIGSTEQYSPEINSTENLTEQETEQEIGDQEEASYLEQVFAGTTLIMNILVIILVLIFFGGLIALLVFCRSLVKKKGCKCAQTVLRKAESKLMFSSVLRAALESYFLVCIGTLYAIMHPKFDEGEDQITFAISLLILTYLIVFPIAQHKFLIKKFGTLGEEQNKDKYGSLYQNVNHQKKHSLRFTLYFCARRFAFALTIVLLKDSIVLQILACDAAVLGMLSFYVAGAPMSDKFNNFIQIFNEIVICLALASLVLFTDFIGDPVERYEWGYTLLKLIASSVSVNVFILLATIVTAIYISIHKLYLKRKKAKITKELEAKRAKNAKNVEKATVLKKRKPLAVELEVIVEEEDPLESDRSIKKAPSKPTSKAQNNIQVHRQRLSISSSSSRMEKSSPHSSSQDSKSGNESEVSQSDSESQSESVSNSSIAESYKKSHRYQGSDVSVSDIDQVEEPAQAKQKIEKAPERRLKASSHYKATTSQLIESDYDPTAEQSILDDGSLAIISDQFGTPSRVPLNKGLNSRIVPNVFEADWESTADQVNRKSRKAAIRALINNSQPSKN